MPSTVRPRGPLPARVYWTRRLVVLAVPLLLVVVLARVLGGSSDGTGRRDRHGHPGRRHRRRRPRPPPGRPPARRPRARRAARARRSARRRRAAETLPPEPVLAEPTGPCTDSDIVATPVITVRRRRLRDIPITINLRTNVAEACTWQASPETMTVTITSRRRLHLEHPRVPGRRSRRRTWWSGRPSTRPVVVTWSAKRSDETCSDRTAWAMPGFYHVEAAALGGEAPTSSSSWSRPSRAWSPRPPSPSSRVARRTRTATPPTPPARTARATPPADRARRSRQGRDRALRSRQGR